MPSASLGSSELSRFPFRFPLGVLLEVLDRLEQTRRRWRRVYIPFFSSSVPGRFVRLRHRSRASRRRGRPSARPPRLPSSRHPRRLVELLPSFESASPSAAFSSGVVLRRPLRFGERFVELVESRGARALDHRGDGRFGVHLAVALQGVGLLQVERAVLGLEALHDAALILRSFFLTGRGVFRQRVLGGRVSAFGVASVAWVSWVLVMVSCASCAPLVLNLRSSAEPSSLMNSNVAVGTHGLSTSDTSASTGV